MNKQAPMYFHRPEEYDPTLIGRVAPSVQKGNALIVDPAKVKEKQLKNEFGLSDDESDHEQYSDGEQAPVESKPLPPASLPSSSSSRQQSAHSTHHPSSHSHHNHSHTERLAELERDLSAETRARVEAEQMVRQQQQQIKSLNSLAQSLRATLSREYKQQIRDLQETVDSQRQQLREDDEIMEALHQRLDALEQAPSSGAEPSPAVDRKALVNRSLERELQESQLRVKQLEARLLAAEKGESVGDTEKKSPLPKGRAEDSSLSLDSIASSPEESAGPSEPKKSNLDGAAMSQLQTQLKERSAELERVRSDLAAAVKEREEAARKWDVFQRECDALREQCSKASNDLSAAKSQSQVAEAQSKHSAELQAALELSQQQHAALEAQVTELKKVLASDSAAAQKIAELEAEKTSLEEMLRNLDELVRRKDEEAEALKEKVKQKLALAQAQNKKIKEEYAAIKAKLQEQSEEIAKKGGESDQITQQLQQERARADELQSRADTLQAQVEQQKQLVGAQQSKQSSALRQLRAKWAAHRQGFASARSQIAVQLSAFARGELGGLAAQMVQAASEFSRQQQESSGQLAAALKAEAKERRRLFNLVQELKGNVRVYCRVRPLAQKELAEASAIEFPTDPTDHNLRIRNEARGADYAFEFEQLFRPDDSQEKVFGEVGPLVTSVLDGYNVCIFAYGQTGSGKTFTMEGPANNKGVNHRALATLFDLAAQRVNGPMPTTYSIRISMLEIYNEKIQDLLCGNSAAGSGLKVTRGADGQEVAGLTICPVSALEEALALQASGARNRAVGQTDMNEHSSRSHLVFSVYVEGITTSPDGKETSRSLGKLHLVDLAGSERVSRSNAQGQRLKEAQGINYSLSALGNCIEARVKNSGHVPYRDSQLTFLLQDSLEKNSKTLMFVNISPAAADAAETITSLKFADRVRKVELGPVKKNAGSPGPSSPTSAGASNPSLRSRAASPVMSSRA